MIAPDDLQAQAMVASLMLLVALGINVVIFFKHRDPVFPLVLAWAALAISKGRNLPPEVTSVRWVARGVAVGGLALAGSAVLSRALAMATGRGAQGK